MTTLTVGSHRIDLSIPAVMTIVNVTPDSFYAGSRTASTETIAARVREAAAAGTSMRSMWAGTRHAPERKTFPPARRPAASLRPWR